jgi:TM2 domain-containing membrane protein YozV
MQEQRQVVVVRNEKSMGVAYALLILFGQLGLHRFYLNRAASGIAQLLLGLIGWCTSFLIIGFVLLIPLWIWLAVDLFLTAGMVRTANAA